ncbi:hypothetical protein GQ457_08G036940 [Hibiscus cannabinus]
MNSEILNDSEVSSDVSTFANKQISIRLDDSNFLLWRQQVVLMVRGLDLEHYLSEMTVAPPKLVRNDAGEMVSNVAYRRFMKQDSSLASWLLSTISPSVLPKLVGSETSAAIWKAVTQLYSKISTTKVMHLHCRLRAMRKGTLSMGEYTSQIKEICDLLASCGSPVSDIEHTATILNGLPAEYDPFTAVITASREPYSLEAAVSVLTDAETRLMDPLRIPVSINYARYESEDKNRESDGYRFGTNRSRDGSRDGSRGRSRGRARPQCQLCGKIGHLVDRCWHRFDQSFKGVSSRHSHGGENQANYCQYASEMVDPCYEPFVQSSNTDSKDVTATSPQINSITVQPSDFTSTRWFPDSGATNHVTPEVQRSVTTPNRSGKGQVILGDGSSIDIAYMDDIAINTSARVLHLSSVLHVPQIRKNLMSVSQFSKDNSVYFEFHHDECVVKDEKTHAIVLKGRQESGLYYFTVNSAMHKGSVQSGLHSSQCNQMNVAEGGSRTGTPGVQRIISSTQSPCVNEEPPVTTQQLANSATVQPSTVEAVAEPDAGSLPNESDLSAKSGGSMDIQGSGELPNVDLVGDQSDSEAQGANVTAADENETEFVDEDVTDFMGGTSVNVEHDQTESNSFVNSLYLSMVFLQYTQHPH